MVIALFIWLIGITLLTYCRGRYNWNSLMYDLGFDCDIITLLILIWPLTPILMAGILFIGSICLALKAVEDKGKHHKILSDIDSGSLNKKIDTKTS
jgi:hypothetical protein